MPELAEVQLVADQLNQLAPYQISKIDLTTPQWLKQGELLPGTIVKIERWGKRLKFIFDDQRCWVISLGMTGSVRFQEHLSTHEVLIISGKKPIVFYDPRKFGNIHCFNNIGEAEKYFRDKIGLDAAKHISGSKLQELFNRRKISIKAALLNQKPLAGIGNYLADEILWQAQIHPLATCNTLSVKDWEKISTSKDQVISKALSQGGLSMKDYVQTDGSKGEMSQSLQVYGRKGEKCPRCATIIEKIYVAQRGTHYCPTCQIV